MRLLGRRCLAIAALTLFLVSLAHAATEKTLYDFGAPGSHDGTEPYCNPVLDSNGNLFGTTLLGGTYNAGIIFELSPSENGQWVETILYEFTGGSDGGYPLAGLIFDGQGNLYGTGSGGGARTGRE